MRTVLRLLLVPAALVVAFTPALAEDSEYSELPPADDGMAVPTTRAGAPIDKPPVDDNVVVPEPATLALLGAGLVTLGLVRRRRSRG